ncbi:hypothetical protein OBBRIDRAFT_793069, partial [Obba rivulosa]
MSWNKLQEASALLGVLGFSLGGGVMTGVHIAGPWARNYVSIQARRDNLHNSLLKCKSLLSRLKDDDKFMRRILDKMVPGFLTQFELNFNRLNGQYWDMESMLNQNTDGAWTYVSYWNFNRKHIEILQHEVMIFLEDQVNTSTAISSHQTYKDVYKQYEQLLMCHHEFTPEEFDRKVDELVQSFARIQAASDNPFERSITQPSVSAHPMGHPLRHFNTAPELPPNTDRTRDIPLRQYCQSV